MSTTGRTDPPGYAWDWLARQRLVWLEAARRLGVTSGAPRGPHPDVPDWSDLVGPGADRAASAADGREGATPSPRDWSALDTRADVVAALRAGYPDDPAVRRATDGAVIDLAFLGRIDVPLTERGVRSVPRGMRWWWSHLGGADVPHSSTHAPVDEPSRALPLQLRLADVLDGYGDAEVASLPAGRMDR